MKQTGKTWIDAEGHTIPVTRVSQNEKLAETYGQRIAAEAVTIANRMQSAKSMFLAYGEEMLNRVNADNIANGKKPVGQITFYVFDKSFRFEYRKKEQIITVWKATKEKPAYKDYEQVILEMNAAAILFTDTPPTTEVKEYVENDVNTSMKGLGIDLETMKEHLKDEVDFDELTDEQQEQLKRIAEKPVKREDPEKTKEPIGKPMSGFEKAIKEAATKTAELESAKSFHNAAVSNDTGALPLPEMVTGDTAPDGPSDDTEEEIDAMDKAKSAADSNIASLFDNK